MSILNAPDSFARTKNPATCHSRSELPKTIVLPLQRFRAIELCAGAGGQALGLESAGFDHVALIENDRDACTTLRENRPEWNVIEFDLRSFRATDLREIDLLAGGVPCQPFSIGGKQKGHNDERDLFPQALRVIAECKPTGILLENVRGLADAKFLGYRERILQHLIDLGYTCEWRVINAVNFGVPQCRRRFILAGLRGGNGDLQWPAQGATDLPSAQRRRSDLRPDGWEWMEGRKAMAAPSQPTGSLHRGRKQEARRAGPWTTSGQTGVVHPGN